MALKGKRILLIGASGLLGKSLQPLLQQANATVVSTSATAGRADLQLDISNGDSVETALRDSRADCVINCAAYTAVDLAETNYTNAFAVNAEGVFNLARSCGAHGVTLAHISTDYVFGGGTQRTPYKEEDSASPLGVYGLSKWYGELLLRTVASDQALIVRTSWLHGKHGNNFIDTMLHLSKSMERIKVVNDQVGSLTWAPWLASCVVSLLAKEVTGVVHASSEGEVSWYEVAKELFRQADKKVEVIPVSTDEFPRPAPRPAYSALNTSKLQQLLTIPSFTWKDSIAMHLADRKNVEAKDPETKGATT